MSITPQTQPTAQQESWVKIHVRDLVLGMFVIELDRPWRDTPFPINGFHLRKWDQIQSLRSLCQWVYIDSKKGTGVRARPKERVTLLSSARKRAPESMALKVQHDVYPRTKSVKQEIDTASRLYKQLGSRLNETIRNAREHKPLGMPELYRLGSETIDCVIRNPDGFIWYLNTSEQGDCLLRHSVRAAIWATVLACHVGFERDELEALFVGTLLADIGMAKFPPEFVLRQGPFSRKQYLAYQRHVGVGVDLLRIEGEVDPAVISIVRGHHERHDGRGFPRGQRGDQIAIPARVAHLAYSYERLLKRSSRSDLSPATAVSRLYKQRMIKFPEQLVFEFIKALGMFPAGSVVELATGEIGIVTEQNPNQRLTPKIAVVTTNRKKLRKEFDLINQGEQKDLERVKAITRSLKPGTNDVHPAEFTERIFGRRIGWGKLGLRF